MGETYFFEYQDNILEWIKVSIEWDGGLKKGFEFVRGMKTNNEGVGGLKEKWNAGRD